MIRPNDLYVNIFYQHSQKIVIFIYCDDVFFMKAYRCDQKKTLYSALTEYSAFYGVCSFILYWGSSAALQMMEASYFSQMQTR